MLVKLGVLTFNFQEKKEGEGSDEEEGAAAEKRESGSEEGSDSEEEEVYNTTWQRSTWFTF